MTLGSVIIVGSGVCGTRAAFSLREKGHQGTITLIGEEPHLPYERPQLSKPFIDDDVPPATTDERLALASVRFLRGRRVVAIDRQRQLVTTDDDVRLPYDRLVLATGAIARRLTHPGDAASNVSYLRTLDDAKAIRARLHSARHVVIIGGGFVGMELAATATQMGAQVSIVEGQPRILKRAVPPEIAEVLARRHAEAGVNIVLNATVSAIEATGSAGQVTLADGTKLDADLIVAGIGSAPETSLALATGLDVADGIVVDQYLRTSDLNIFAAGDCCSFPHALYGPEHLRLESWQGALDQAELVAANIVGSLEPYTSVPWFWSDQYDLTVQVAGMPREGQRTVRRERPDGSLLVFQLTGGGRLSAASGIGRGNSIAKDIRLARRLIEESAWPDPALLARPDGNLKSLLSPVVWAPGGAA